MINIKVTAMSMVMNLAFTYDINYSIYTSWVLGKMCIIYLQDRRPNVIYSYVCMTKYV